MGKETWCLIIDNAQGTWTFDITPQGITLLDTTLCNRLTFFPELNLPETTNFTNAFRNLELPDCSSLASIPSGLNVSACGSVPVQDCASLTSIPSGLNVSDSETYGQWKPSLEDIALAESFGRAVPGWMLWLLVQWDRAKEIWAKARH
jgi:hypothetical protein